MKASGMDGGIANAGDGTIFALAPDSDSAWEAALPIRSMKRRLTVVPFASGVFPFGARPKGSLAFGAGVMALFPIPDRLSCFQPSDGYRQRKVQGGRYRFNRSVL